MAVVAPMPRARQATAEAVKPGFLARRRTAYRTSCRKADMGVRRMDAGLVLGGRLLGFAGDDDRDREVADFGVQDDIVLAFLGDGGEGVARRGFEGEDGSVGGAAGFALGDELFEIGGRLRIGVVGDGSGEGEVALGSDTLVGSVRREVTV